MNTKKLLLCSLLLMFTLLTAVAQKATNKQLSAKDDIPFGKKLPPPDLTEYPGRSLPHLMYSDINTALIPGTHHPDINAIKKKIEAYRQQLQNNRNVEARPFHDNVSQARPGDHKHHNVGFHLTKDINALAESNPANRSDWYANTSYAILNQVMYFAADDGIHGNELWRSDGTDAGTFIVKDAEPGTASCNPIEITEANGKIYFSATTSLYGQEAWVSDGTESGTQLLVDLNPLYDVPPAEFVAMGNKVYFAASVNDYMDALYETDGTTAGTKLVKSLGLDPGGYFISQPVISGGLLYFTFFSYTTFTYELWRSDGTDAGTFHIGTNIVFLDFPVQLTNYNNRLYFTADADGTGDKLWVTDGTDAGTVPAPGNNGISIRTDNIGTAFPVIDNVLYMAGSSLNAGAGLYKYNAANTDGVTLVKNTTQGNELSFIVPTEMKVANNILYFKVTNNNGGGHDELWSSNGTEASTRLINKFLPGEPISHLYSGNNTLYFSKHDKFLGTELWKVAKTFGGTFSLPVADIFKGATGSYPDYFTAFKGKLFFSARDEKKGNELFMTKDFGVGTTLVKDINFVSTSNSYAGYYVRAFAPLGNSVYFSASEKVHGYELYKSDGTEEGTELLNDILPGEKGSFGETSSFPIGNMIAKNNSVYFITKSSDTTYSIYKTNGLKQGLHKVVPDYQTYPQYFIQDFNVADNDLVFYVLYNYHTSQNELWRSDGTVTGTFQLASTLSGGYNLNVAGNTAFFVGGDAVNGYELWKSDGSISGTGIVKDINPGAGNSNPAGMFIYKKEVYFAANNGAGPSFWKSDGTSTGTIQLANIDPWYSSVLATARVYFEVSNNILYFSAVENSVDTKFYRTDGTVAGTYVVKDINPDADDYFPNPSYLTDVNGTLFFIGNDGLHGAELWKSDGTEKGTRLVKDITPGANPSILYNLISFGGKLYFTNNGALWSSDGTADGTTPVDDGAIIDVQIGNIVATPGKLFLSGYTLQYGYELYAGKVNKQTERLEITKTTDIPDKTMMPFKAVLYPNPAVSNVTLQITGDIKNVSVFISDMSGKKLWQTNNSINNKSGIINLPTEKYIPGIYTITVTNGTESKTLKLVK